MEHDEVYKAKAQFLLECFAELMNHRQAFLLAGRENKPLLNAYAKKIGADGMKGFSQSLEALNENMGSDAQLKALVDLINRFLDVTSGLEFIQLDLLDPEHEFADKWGDDFITEYFAAISLFISEKADPRVDLVIMKMCLSLGKIVGRLERDGRRNKDQTSYAGSTQHKRCVPREEVIQTAKDVVEKLKRLGIKPQKERVKRDVRDRLLKSESEKENPKDVYKPDNIKEILKDVWSDIL